MFPSTGRYDRTMKRDKINKQLPATLIQKGHQQLNYGLPMGNSRHQQQQLIEHKTQLRLDDDKYFLLSIIKAHEETCDYTKDKATSLIEKSRKNPTYARCSALMSCPLNPLPPPSSGNGVGGDAIGGTNNNRGEDGGLEDFGERFSPAIRGVVEFAKRIPGFGLLAQDDQVTLLKAGVFEVLLVRLACMFDKASDSMICLNGMVLKRDSLHSQAGVRHLLDSMFAFAERLNGLNLTDTEIALFCSIVVISPDRSGLINIDLIGRINRKCVDLLNQSIKANHHSSSLFNTLINKITDLRTLNKLHSEKLLACKMGPKNGQSYNNLSSSPSPSPISSSSSSSSSSLSSLTHHSGNSNSNSSNGDRNCNSPGNMNNPSNCSYASLLPVQWQNFSIRDTNDGPTSSSSSSSSSSSHSSRLNNQSNNNSPSYGLGDDDNLSSYDRNSVTSSDHILTKSSKSANGLNNNNNQYSNADYQHNGHNQQNGSTSSSLANHFILGQRLLQSSNNNTNSLSSNSANNNTNGNSLRDKNYGTRDSPINSLNHHHGRYHDQHHHHYDNYCTNNGSSDVYTKMRRVDSPTDSGIESGKEQCNGSTPTASVCSSPRSACDDKVKDIVSDSECSTISEKNTVSESIDDMPMLKRALQAPPLINTNMLMDEAYRHHKKFRATKVSRDCEPATSSTNIVHSSNSNPNHCLASPTSTSSLSSSCLSPPSSTNITTTPTTNNCDSLASTHSTLIKVLESAPRYIGDLNQQAPSCHQSSSPPYHNNNNYTSLNKCDLLHSLIMKGSGGNGGNNNRGDRVVNGEGGTVRVGDSMPPPLDLSRKRDLLYL